MSRWPVVDAFASMAGMIEQAPSLGRSDDSAVDSSSTGPQTPCDRSPFAYAQTYTIPPPSMDLTALPQRAGTPQPSQFRAALPDIMDPETAANVPIRTVCCIGAGYVGMSRDHTYRCASVETDMYMKRRTDCCSHRIA